MIQEAVLSLACLFFAGTATVQAAETPNVVYILADDMGYGDVSAYNEDFLVRTPNLDKLASEGVRFTDAHSTGSFCSPTRYALLTGENYFLRATEQKPEYRFGDGEHWDAVPTLPRLFQHNGYDTAMIGKWHLPFFFKTKQGGEVRGKVAGSNLDRIDFSKPIVEGPQSWGFDYFFGFPTAPGLPPHATYDGRLPVGEVSEKYKPPSGKKGPATKDWSDEAILPTLLEKSLAYIHSRRGNDKPFFFYFALTAPHTPIAPEARFIENEFERKNTYLPFLRQVDWTVGQVLKALDEAGLSDNTMVIFTSDNGPASLAGRIRFLDDQGQQVRYKPSGPWRGAKFHEWEGGHRMPFLLRWPGKVQPGTVSDVPFMQVDAFATFAEMLDVKLPPDVAIDSVSVLDAWTGKATKEDYKDRILVHTIRNPGGAIRHGKWKLLLESEARVKKLRGELVELYDLENDPQEETNLAAEHPEVVERLSELWDAEKKRLQRVAR